VSRSPETTRAVAIQARQPQVDQRHVGLETKRRFEATFAVRRFVDVVSRDAECHAQHVAHVVVVFDDEHAAARRRRFV